MKRLKRPRLDEHLVAEGHFADLESAKLAVMAGRVVIEGEPPPKPGRLLTATDRVHVKLPDRYVGRGGLKLEKALIEFSLDVGGRVALDIGSSTGGFTDCLLQHGAAFVHSCDVGRGLLAWRLRQDPRVILHEGLNARETGTVRFSPAPDMAVGDVSFISLTKILPAVFDALPGGSDAIFLIKPQFEAPRGELPPGGVVTDAATRKRCVEKIAHFVSADGHRWLGAVESPITGRDGNVEYLARMQTRAAKRILPR